MVSILCIPVLIPEETCERATLLPLPEGRAHRHSLPEWRGRRGQHSTGVDSPADIPPSGPGGGRRPSVCRSVCLPAST